MSKVYKVRLKDRKTYRVYVYVFNAIEDMSNFLSNYAESDEFEITIESRERMVGEC